jgi:hypothetical protein
MDYSTLDVTRKIIFFTLAPAKRWVGHEAASNNQDYDLVV